MSGEDAVFLLGAAVLLMIAWSLLASTRIERLQADLRVREQTITEILQDTNLRRISAAALRRAAEKYDDPREKIRLATIARDQYIGDRSVPSLWMLAEADLLEAEPGVEVSEDV